MTLAEAHQLEFQPDRINPLHSLDLRLDTNQFSQNMVLGGLPVPLFARDLDQRQMYWRSWLDVTLMRDLRKGVGRTYDPDIALKILQQAAKTLSEGELPTLKNFSLKSTRLRPYLDAFVDSFLFKKLNCHEQGTGKEAWLFEDTGLLYYLLPKKSGEEVNQALARTYWLNEVSAGHEYQGKSFSRTYFKSARGSAVDLVWNDIPIKVIARTSDVGWEERSLAAAMKKLKQPQGILVAPVNQPTLQKTGISVVPWSYWS